MELVFLLQISGLTVSLAWEKAGGFVRKNFLSSHHSCLVLCEEKPFCEATSATLKYSGIPFSFTNYTRGWFDHSDFLLYQTFHWIESLTWSQMFYPQGFSYKHIHWFCSCSLRSRGHKYPIAFYKEGRVCSLSLMSLVCGANNHVGGRTQMQTFLCQSLVMATELSPFPQHPPISTPRPSINKWINLICCSLWRRHSTWAS